MRDEIAAIAIEVLRNIEIDRKMKDEGYLWGKVVELIESSPQHAAILKDYDDWATAGKEVLEGNSTSDRFSETLRKWATSKNSPYREIAVQHGRICYQIDRLQSGNSKTKTRQANS